MKKSVLFSIIFCLIFSNLSFAQTENPYQDFDPVQLKENKDYSRNFAPNNFSHKILYACMQEMVNAARAQYAFQPAMKTDIRLDSAATMQATYQASKEEKTIENLAPYRTTEQRLRKYGLGTHGVELASKAKATLGDKDYTYYDVCLELVRPVLKNSKSAAVLLDRQYTYLGFGYEFDKYMKSIYVSFILGNDRTLNVGKPQKLSNDLPYTRTKLGLADYDEQLCKKCMADKNVEILSECLSVKDGVVYFSHDDIKAVKRVIGKEGDAIVLDFVQHSQYPCDGNEIVDQDRPNHGFMTKIITFEDMLADNQVSGKKVTKLLAPIADVPQEIPDDSEFDINIILVKDGKYVCRNVIKKQVECKNANFTEPMFFVKDSTTIQPKGDWVPVAESKTISFTIPFEDKVYDLTADDVQPYLSNLNEPAFVVESAEIVVGNSANYVNDAAMKKSQERRAKSLVNVLKQSFPGMAVEPTVKYDDGWDAFMKEVVNDPDYGYFALFSKAQVLSEMKANGGKIGKELDEKYLKKQRCATVTLNIRYKIDGDNEQEFSVVKFNRTLAAKNYGLAMAIQQYIMGEVEKGHYSSTAAKQLEIPTTKVCQPFLINRLYMIALADKGVNLTSATEMIDVVKLDNTNTAAQFNDAIAKVAAGTPFADLNDIALRQANIDRLYVLPKVSQELVNNLNMEFQFRVIDYLKSQPATAESSTLLDNTYAKIKQIRNPVMSSWKNAYKLAAIFVKNGDYVYAVSLMEPFINDKSISDDFLFSFISLCAVREEMYMSGNFTAAVRLASERAASRLCGLFDKLPVVIFDNQEVKEIICKTCR
jgi:hypothetical protein